MHGHSEERTPRALENFEDPCFVSRRGHTYYYISISFELAHKNGS